MTQGYDAGTSVGKYLLDTSQFEAAVARAKKLYAELGAAANVKPPPLPAVPTPSAAPLAGITAAQARAATTAAKLATEQQKAATEAQRLATEQQKTTAAVTGTARAEQLLARDTANAAAAQDRAAQAALRRQQAEARAAKANQNGGLGPALPRTFAGITKGGALAIGALGIATSIPEVVRFGVESGKASLALDRQLRLTKELTGTQAAYNQVIAAAKTQQQLYGGSLQENIAGIQGLVVTARSTGAELKTLINLAQRLAVLDPAQGAEGARIALSEVLSGDPRSLARRYEIPLSALEKIKDESVPVADRLKVLDQYLSKIGITSATVNNVVTDQAKIYNDLGSSADAAKVAAGGLLATLLSYPAQVTTKVLVSVSSGLSALGDVDKNLQATAVHAFAGAKSLDDYGKRTKVANDQLAPFGARIATLSPALFAYAQALQKSGLSAEDAFNKSLGYRDIIDRIAEAQTKAGGAGGTWEQSLSSLGARAAQVADQSEANRAGVESLTSVYIAGKLTSDEFAAALTGLEAQQQRNTAAAQEEEREQRRLSGQYFTTSDALAKLRAEMHANAEASTLAAAKQDAQSATTALLDEKNKLAVDSFLALNPQIDASAVASAAAADGYSPQIAKLIELAVEARNAQGALADLNGAGAVTEGRSERDTPQALAEARTAGIRAAQERAAALERARLDQLLRTGTAAQIVTQRQKEYNEAVKQFGKDSAQAINAQTALIEAQNAANKPKRGPKDPNAAGLSGLDQDAIQKGETLKAQLDAVNALLSRTNLTEHQRNDLLEKRRGLEEDIRGEIEKQADAQLNAQLDTVKDAQARLKEARESAGLQRQLQSGRFSAAQQETARLRLAEIGLEQEKRRRDIAKEVEQAGGVAAVTTPAPAAGVQAPIPVTVTQPLPLPNAATLSPLAPGAVTLNLTIQLDGTTGAATVVNPPPGLQVGIIEILNKAAVRG